MNNKIYLTILICLCVLASGVFAQMLLVESFDYESGYLNSCNGGAGWNGAWVENDSDGDAYVVDGLTFSDYSVSGNAAEIQMTDTSGSFKSTIAARYVGVDFPSSADDLWVSFLYKQPGAPLAANAGRMAEVRCEDLTFRMRAKNSDSQGIAVGYDNITTANGTVSIQDGNTYLIITKFEDVGDASGGSAKMWVINETGYDNIKSGGITETELDNNKVMSAVDAHSQQIFGTTERVLLMVYDNSGTDFSGIFDELKYGTTLADVAEPGARLLIADNLLIDGSFDDVYSSGCTPIDIAVGDFATSVPGDEFAVIWDEPVSNIDGTDYYSIIIYDQDGLELDRCGRSSDKWLKITAGNFVSDTGYILINDNYEIAATKYNSGYYPIYIFRKGFKDPAVTLQSTNTTQWSDITAGNFKTDGDDYDEVAGIKTGSTTINYYKPTDTSWSDSTTSVAVDTFAIAGGDFDTNASGDEVAGISNTPVSGKRPVRLYKVSGSGYYSSAATNQDYTIADIAAGDLDYSSDGDEIALAGYWYYHVSFFAPGSSDYFKTYDSSILGVRANAIDVGNLVVDTALTDYDNVENFTSTDYGSEIASWGEHVLFLPSAAQTTNIPVFWINTKESMSYRHSKTVPIVR
ncbi:MAG: hypothetical protein ACIAQZ_08390 [Sedimentisphaeraceae bacterium JB056]